MMVNINVTEKDRKYSNSQKYRMQKEEFINTVDETATNHGRLHLSVVRYKKTNCWTSLQKCISIKIQKNIE